MPGRPKSILILFGLIFIITLLGACSPVVEIDLVNEEHGKTRKIDKDGITVAMIPKFVGIPYFNAAERGAKRAAKDLDLNLIYTGPDSADAVQQELIIKNLINRGVDVLCVSCNDPNTLTGILTKAKRNGIRVITWDSDCEKNAREFFVLGVDPEQMGRHVMDYLAKLIDYKGEFAIVSGAVTAANINAWIYWTKEQLEEKYPDIELLTIVPSEDNRQKAYIQTKNIIKKYPNIKGIIGYCDTAGPGVAQAVDELGLNGKVKVVAVAVPNSIEKYLKNNACQVSILYDIEKMGYLTVALAARLAIEDKMPQDGQDVPTVGKIRVNEGSTVILGDPMDFTIENVDEFVY